MGETFVDDQKCHSAFFSSWVVFEKRREKKKERDEKTFFDTQQTNTIVCLHRMQMVARQS